MSDLDDKIVDLRVAQSETHTMIRNLTDVVDKYIKGDDLRHRDLFEYRVESSKHLASIAAIVQDMKKDVDTAVNTHIPDLQQKVSGNEAKISSHSWLLRAVVGATLIAMLGTTITGLATCNFRNPSAEATFIQQVDSGLDDEAIE